MPPEARDQRAVVNMLAALPFSDAKLQKAREALGGDLPALSTALESAAARARDQSVAGRLLLEASRVQLQELKQRRRGLMLLKAALEQHPEDTDARNELAEALRDPENQTVYEGMLKQRADSLAKLAHNDVRLAVRAGEAYSRLADFYDTLGDSARSAETRRLAAKLGGARSLSPSPAAPRTAAVKASSPASVKPSAQSSSAPPASPRLPRVNATAQPSPQSSAPPSPSGLPLPSVRATQERSPLSGRMALPAQPRSMSPRPGAVAAARPPTPSTAPTRPPPPDSSAPPASESSLSRPPVSAVPRPVPRPGSRSGAPPTPSAESVGEAPTIEVEELGTEEMAALLRFLEEESEK